MGKQKSLSLNFFPSNMACLMSDLIFSLVTILHIYLYSSSFYNEWERGKVSPSTTTPLFKYENLILFPSLLSCNLSPFF